MQIFCEQCQAVRESVFKCVEVTGRVLRACAICASVLIVLPVDHLHSHDREPTGAPPKRLVVAMSTTASLSSTVAVNWTTPGYDPDT